MGGVPDDIEVHAGVVEGAAAPALVAQVSCGEDVIIVGASRRRRFGPLNSVGRHCVRLAGCPVVVVPAPELARQGGRRALARAVQREAQRYVEAGGNR
jgi:nucleotide-binding universal stress UspA family protein